MKAEIKTYEKIWHRFESYDQKLLKIETELPINSSKNKHFDGSKVSEIFRKRLRMMPKMATGQYFIIQLVHRFGFEVAEIASWCNLSPLLIFNIYHSKYGKWPSDFVFEKLLRFYCVVLRHNLQPAQTTAIH